MTQRSYRNRRGCPAFERRHPGALRRVLGGVRGSHLPAGQNRARPRRGQGPPADRLRAAVLTDRSADRGGGSSTATPPTRRPWAAQIAKLKTRFGLSHIALVGDRGMLTSARIRDELRPAHLDWIRRCAPPDQAPGRRRRAAAVTVRRAEPIEITHPDYPGERLCAATTRPWPTSAPANVMSCWRPPRKNYRRSPQPPTATASPCAAPRRSLCGWATAQQVQGGQHFDLHITDDAFTFTRNQDSIAAEAALDGIYVLRTNLPTDTLERDEVVGRYKDLAESNASSAPSTPNWTYDPSATVCQWEPHVFCRLSYCISWHMKQALAPILFQDNDKPAAAAKRTNPVAPAQRSDQALAKAARKRTDNDTPDTASPACSPTWPPSAPTPSNPPTTWQHSHDHHPHPTAAAGPRTTRRLPPPRPRVVSTPTS